MFFQGPLPLGQAVFRAQGGGTYLPGFPREDQVTRVGVNHRGINM